MIDSLPPGLILLLGSLLVPLLKGQLRSALLLALPIASFAHLISLPTDHTIQLELFDYTLTVARIDSLSLVWGYIFHIAVFLNVIFGLHVKDNVQLVCGPLYGAAAIGAVFAGDLITLFVFWELTSLSSVFLIWASRTERSFRAGMRYLIVQVGSGVALLAGAIFHYQATGSLAFDQLGIGSLGTNLIFFAFAIKCAFPLLHMWLEDAYPESTPTGAVWLSAFTTKLAVYALARGFPGTEMLIWIGASMTAFPIFFAVIENDLRRVLAYSLNNQLGFMVVGVGIGTDMALNGTAAHAFCHILYKALLFMSMGAVLHRAGTVKGSELGGLYKSMPWTMLFCCVGAASISAFPLFSGFVSKSLIITETASGHHTIVWLMLIFASAGVFHHSGIKIPYFAFFAHDSGIRCKEAPWNMLLAMGITAALCIGIGVFPEYLYAILPYQGAEPIKSPYDSTHVMTQMQLLFFSALAFTVLMRTGIYPKELRSTNLDFDVVYRRWLPGLGRAVAPIGRFLWSVVIDGGKSIVMLVMDAAKRLCSPMGLFGRTEQTRNTVLEVAVILAVLLILYYA